MSAFTNGFNFGFLTGMLNNTFSSIGMFNGGLGCCGGWFGGFNMPFFGGFAPPIPTSPPPSMFIDYSNYASLPMPTVGGSVFAATPTQSFISPTIDTFNFNGTVGNYSTVPQMSMSTFNFGSTFNFTPFNFTPTQAKTDTHGTGKKTTAKYSDDDTSYFCYDSEKLYKKWKKKEHVTQEFCNKVVAISKRVQCDPNDLMCLMNGESGINPAQPNMAGGKAMGLIQFMPKTAEGLGTSCEALSKMSACEQLNYVEKYLVNAKKSAGLSGKKISAGMLGALTFLPAYANKDILCEKGSEYYEKNKGLDYNNDGKITKKDLADRLHNKYDIA